MDDEPSVTAARLAALESAFVNLVALLEPKIAEGLETAVRETGEAHLMAPQSERERRQPIAEALLRLGRQLEARIARRRGAAG